MTAGEFRDARAAVIAGQAPSRALLDDCLRTVRLLIRTAGLPAHYSPLGVWSEEAIEEVFADWVAERLIGRGQLLATLQRAPALNVFRRMCETSVRQQLIDGLERSQSANLYERVVSLLTSDERFVATGSGAGRVWALAGGPDAHFDGDDTRLLSVAWSLGEFVVIRYDPQARKLSPLLDAGELDRFVAGMLGAGAMSAASIMRALQARFAIEAPSAAAELDPETPQRGEPDPEVAILRAELVTATLAELSARQAGVLLGLDSGISGRDLARKLGCSTGTISHERGQIAQILARLGTDAEPVLKDVVNALLMEDR
jgi:hypothetical protein